MKLFLILLMFLYSSIALGQTVRVGGDKIVNKTLGKVSNQIPPQLNKWQEKDIIGNISSATPNVFEWDNLIVGKHYRLTLRLMAYIEVPGDGDQFQVMCYDGPGTGTLTDVYVYASHSTSTYIFQPSKNTGIYKMTTNYMHCDASTTGGTFYIYDNSKMIVEELNNYSEQSSNW